MRRAPISQVWLLAALLAVGCSSKDKEQEPAPAPTAEGSPIDAETVRDCRERGDGAACLAAAAAQQRQELANELNELACIHGQAAGCVAQAEQQRTPVSWYGMACRRGDAQACAKADPWAAWVGQRIEVTRTSPGAVGARLREIYVQTVADCLAQAPAAERDAAGTIAIEVALEAGAPTDVRVTSDASESAACLRAAGKRWRFPADAGAGPHVMDLTVAPAAATEATDGGVAPQARGPLTAKATITEPPRGVTAEWRTIADKKIQRMYLSGIKVCYRAALVRTPKLESVLDLALTIGKDGRTSAQVTGTGDEALVQCITEKIASRWRFQPPPSEVAIGVRLTFARG